MHIFNKGYNAYVHNLMRRGLDYIKRFDIIACG
jgi:hypothetical protein